MNEQLLYSEECGACCGSKYLKTQTGEDYRCPSCKGMGYVIDKVTLLETDDVLSELIYIEDKKGQRKWTSKNSCLAELTVQDPVYDRHDWVPF